MAKKRGRKRNFRRYLRGGFDESDSLGTLAANTAIKISVADILIEKAWLSSVVAQYTLNNFTGIALAGPVMIGVAHSAYTLAEIEEWIESTTSWDQGNPIAQEINKRMIRQVGVIVPQSAAILGATLNDGRPLRTKCGWQLASGQTVAFFYYNMGTAAFATTDPQVFVQGHANLWPTG